MNKLGLLEDLALYEPAPAVLQKLSEVVLYAIVAPYSSGKDSIIDWLEDNRPHQFARVVGDTSRLPRPGEIDGTTYHFRSKTEMVDDLRNGRFVQAVPGFMNNFYATRPEQYPTDKIAVKPIQAREMAKFERLGLKEVKWLQIVPYSDEAWQVWQSRRTYKAKDQHQRDIEAIQSYTLSLVNQSTYFILNDEIEKAAQRVTQITIGRRPDDEVEARRIATCNLEILKKR